MLKISIFSVFLFLSFSSNAACPVADELISDYGISFSGFKKSPPKSNAPQFNKEGDALVLNLPNKKGYTHDGYFHSAVIDVKEKRVWLHRVGGFVSVNEWYGPVKIEKINLAGCATEKYIVEKK